MEDSEKRELTFGEKSVGLSFNPSGFAEVDKCKNIFAEAIDQMNAIRVNPDSNSEKCRIASVAITNIQTAQMWAVKAITWKE